MSLLPLPKQFDLNEWSAIGVTVLCFLVIFILPKKFSTSTVLFIWLFNINFVMIADFTLGVKPFNLYDFMDQPKLELVYNIIHFTFYPGVAYLILYGYKHFKFKGFGTFIYLIGISGVLLLLEWVALKVHILEYVDGKWKLIYSFPVYLFAFFINITLLNFFQTRIKTEAKDS
ncbi:hypothetical protein IM538_08025 [Cytobacillus suaedae]|nr:hypothetical protein IM538_08025 [Cytobacillus suaedae]